MPSSKWLGEKIRNYGEDLSGKKGSVPSEDRADLCALGAGINATDPDEERDPPLPPTPIAFPGQIELNPRAVWSEDAPPPKLRSLFSRIVKPSDISSAHVETINIRTAPECSPDELLPRGRDGSSYILSLSLEPATGVASYADATKIDAVSAKKRKEFEERLAELRLDNDTGYRIINRNTKTGEKPPRLAHMRKFWTGLESMSQYWDTSLDCYYEAPPPASEGIDEQGAKGSKRQRLDNEQLGQISLPIYGLQNMGTTQQGDPTDTFKALIPKALEAIPQTPLASKVAEKSAEPTEITPTEPQRNLRYKGRRTGTGREMPDQFRNDTVRTFVEGIVWAFGCQIAVPRHTPIVQVNKLNVPVRQTAAVYRMPTDRSRARAGWLHGPIMGIQVRPETDFAADTLSEEQKLWRARLDLMREVGGLLQIAQERTREGKKEISPGRGKWWTETPRWGGGSGGEVDGEQQISSDAVVRDVLQMAEEVVDTAKEAALSLVSSKPLSHRLKKRTPSSLWKELKCGSNLWDAKTQYEAIGKEPEGEVDEVFLISSLNHHICILKLTIHPAYLEYLETERLPASLPQDPSWCQPSLQRTPWYDFFDVEQRVKAFQALWGVSAYLMRDVGGSTTQAVATQQSTGATQHAA